MEFQPEIWKTEKFNDLVLYYCNEVYKGNVIQSWTEGCILPFPKKGDLSKTSNYRGITLTSIAAKIYNALLLNQIQPEMKWSLDNWTNPDIEKNCRRS